MAAALEAARRRCAAWDGWLDSAQRELRAAGGKLSWRRLQTALVSHYCSKVHPYCPCTDVWVGCCAIAKVPATYLSREDGFVRLPDADLVGPKADVSAGPTGLKAHALAPAAQNRSGEDAAARGPQTRLHAFIAAGALEAPPSKRQRLAGDADDAAVVQSTVVEGEGRQHKAHVGELPFSATEEAIQEFFVGCGDISKCDLLHTHEGKSRGIAFISFTASAGLQAALKLNGHVFRGRPIKVSEAAGQGAREKGSKGKGKAKGAARRLDKGTGKGEDGKNKDQGKGKDGKSKGSKDSGSREFEVFVGGLPYTTSVECVHKDFSECGEIGRFNMPMAAEGHTGIAFINYSTREAMEKALAFNEKEYGGVWIRVQQAVAPKTIGKGSGKIEMF